MTESEKLELVVILHIGNADETARELSQLPPDAIAELIRAIGKLIIQCRLVENKCDRN